MAVDSQRDEFISKIHALNEGFASFVQEQLKEQKSEVWLEGAREYIKYGEALLEEYKAVREAPASKGPLFGGEAARSKSFRSGTTFGANKESSSANGVSTSGDQTAAPLFGTLPQPRTSGAEKGESKSAGGHFNFGSNKSGDGKPAPLLGTGFSFGGDSSKGGFSFGGGGSSKGGTAEGNRPVKFGAESAGASLFGAFPKSTGDSASNPFLTGGSAGGFGATGGAFAALGNGDDKEASLGQTGEEQEREEEADTGESIANAVDPSASILFSSKAAFYIGTREDGKLSWSNKGKGMLTLRKAKEGSSRPYAVFTTEAGRVLLNASLHKDIKAVKNGTKKVMMSLCWALTEGDSPEMRQVFFSLPSSEQQEQCVEQIDFIGKQ